MKDRSALMIAIVIAGVIFALQLFIKENLFSSANIETAGKLHRIFKAGDILPLLETRSKNVNEREHLHCKKTSIKAAVILHHQEVSECPFAILQSAEHNKAILQKYRLRAENRKRISS